MYSVYLVRHAEKDLFRGNSRNPPLTECGKARAKQLAVMLGDINLEAVYSSDFLRTVSTARPVAESKNIEVQLYDPRKLEEIYQILRARKQDALVVGHGNTTNVLAGMLTGLALEDIDESEYDRLYLAVINDDSAKLHLLHQGFACGA